jgi:NAD(P)-dependent dehydrogenase (short-subunit alcohol dehydrogenase family)
MDAQGKVCLVVGAASGMGRLAAQRWADAGGVVAAADQNEAGLKETAAERSNMHLRRIEVASRDEVDALVAWAESELGPIERVYNAAAIQPTNLLLEQDPDEIRRVMDVNYGGLVNVSLATLPPMLARRRGVLVNFGSIAGWVPNIHFGAYNASKFAGVAFSEVLWHENRGRGVQILCVCPSSVDTPLLAQATSKPRILETGPRPMRPDFVLDAIERAIAKRRFWVFPGAHTAAGWRLRRFLPGLLWAIDHRAEGL